MGEGEFPGDGRTQSSPAAAVFRGTLRLFIRGTDDAIYVNQFNGSTVTGYSAMSNAGFSPDGPGAVTLGTIGLDVFARDVSGRIFVRRLTT